MRVVVSDTSPLRALALLNLLELLDHLYEVVHVPPAVSRELSVTGVGIPIVSLSGLGCIRATAPLRPQEVERLRSLSLGAGEAEAIVVCGDISADGLLADDLRAREIAAQEGLRVIGVLGLLLQAKQGGHIVALAPLLDRLVEEIGFRISAQLRIQVLAQAGEI